MTSRMPQGKAEVGSRWYATRLCLIIKTECLRDRLTFKTFQRYLYVG